jgi:uncharacterized HAD superfamily protein
MLAHIPNANSKNQIMIKKPYQYQHIFVKNKKHDFLGLRRHMVDFPRYLVCKDSVATFKKKKIKKIALCKN